MNATYLQLREEISLYADERSIWQINGDTKNSAGTLCLHLCGNMQHFMGAILGNSGYLRDRDGEFSRRDVPRQTLLAEIDATRTVVQQTLENMADADFFAQYPIDKHGKIVSTDYMLLHLLSHFNYHLGQINYHRRQQTA